MHSLPKDWLITSMDGTLLLRAVQWRSSMFTPTMTWTQITINAMLFTEKSAKGILSRVPHLNMVMAEKYRIIESVSPSEITECDCEVCARKGRTTA